ncbi:MAG: DNA-binding response regulator [Phycisphaerales bacterium]|nr:DNA-binding response regulator [Phycisphaerales bacterium]
MEKNDDGTGVAGHLPRVLLLEDDAGALTVLGGPLPTITADAILTATCDAARYAAATVGPFDIILADTILPDGDGVTVAVALKQLHGSGVIIMSGSKPRAGGLPVGVDVWLVKPVRMPELRRAIQLVATA